MVRFPAVVRAATRAALPTVVLALTILLAGAAPVPAQSAEQEYSRFSGSFAFLNTQPLGVLATGPGFGVDVSAAWALDPNRRFRLRADLRAGIYGRDTRTVCLSETVGCFIEVDVNTDYGSFYLGAGPEVAIPVLGSSLVLDATAGVGSFGVASSIEGVSDPDNQDHFRTEHFSDTFFAWSAGGELRVPISPQVSIALGTHYQHNGRVSYVPEGGVTQNPDGSLSVEAITTDANQMAFTLGVAFHPFVGWTDELDDENDDGF